MGAPRRAVAARAGRTQSVGAKFLAVTTRLRSGRDPLRQMMCRDRCPVIPRRLEEIAEQFARVVLEQEFGCLNRARAHACRSRVQSPTVSSGQRERYSKRA